MYNKITQGGLHEYQEETPRKKIYKMKKKLSLPIIFLSILSLLSLNLSAQEPMYVGAAKCKVCHSMAKSGNQFGLWKKSAHFTAYKTLSNESAVEIAKKAGLTEPPSNSPLCLNCHSPYASLAPKLRKDGVGCEACHGPGSNYKRISTMKDKKLSHVEGLIFHDTDDSKITFCITCHKTDNIYHEVKEFDLQEFWGKIVHLIPNK